MASALDSGMEWATLMYSTSNGPSVMRSPGLTRLTGTGAASGSAAILAASRLAVKAVA